jgi:hypothetical protein
MRSLIRAFNGCFGSLYFGYLASVRDDKQHKSRKPTMGIENLAILEEPQWVFKSGEQPTELERSFTRTDRTVK